MYDDDNYDDGFDEEALARRMRLHLWAKLFAYTRPYRRKLVMLGFFATLTALMDVSFPLITRAVIYARYSTDLQSPASIEDQIRLCRERLQRDGHELVKVYSDRAVSGVQPKLLSLRSI